MASVRSTPRKIHKAEQALEASPLLVPLSKPPNLIKSSPKKSNQSRLTLPLATRQQWLREAEDIGRMDDVQGRLEPTNSEKRGADLTFIDFPVVATNAELQMLTLGAQDGKQSSTVSNKRLPLCVPDARSLPLYCRPFGGVAQPQSTKLKGRKHPFRLHTMASLSQEMRNTLESHLLDKIQGDIWQNEIRSRLARPLSATVFCERSERLDHALSAPQYGQSSSGTPPLYPYSEEAHAFT